MSFSSRPIIECVITENQTSSSSRWTVAENACPKDFQNDALKHFYRHYSDGNPGNCQVVRTFFHQYSTSPFTFLQLRTNSKSYNIQIYSKINSPEEQISKLPINSENFDKKVIKTSVAFDSSLNGSLPSEALSNSKICVNFSPKDSVSRVYSYSMAKNSHDPMLRAFFNSNYSSISTYVGGCENHYQVVQTGEEGTTKREIPPNARRQIWSTK